MKRLLSILLALCTLLSCIPVQAVAADRELPSQQVLTLPVVTDGDDLPAPQGAVGQASLFGFVEPGENVSYAYEGQTSMSFSGDIYILDPVTNKPVTSEPERNGIVQMLDPETGAVAASSHVLDYYGDRYDYDTDTSYYCVSYVYFDVESAPDLAELPTGEYALQLYAGNTIYPLDGSYYVVSSEDLLITEASSSNLYAGCTSFDMEVCLIGFQTEEELMSLSLVLTDSEGNELAENADEYQVKNISYDNSTSWWRIVFRMEVNEDAVIRNQEEYFLQLGYTGTRDLYDGIGYCSLYSHSPELIFDQMLVEDPQTGLIQLTFQTYDPAKYYTLSFYDGSSDALLAQWEGTIPEDGSVQLQLMRNGTTAPMSAYGWNLRARGSWEEDGWTNYSWGDWENPYRNLSSDGGSGSYRIQPATISASAVSWAFTLEMWRASLFQGSGDTLTLVDEEGNEAAQCLSLVETERDDERVIVTGRFDFRKPIPEGDYTLLLNGVEIDSVWVTSRPSWSWRFPFVSYDDEYETFYTNLGCFPISVSAINSGSKLTIQILDEEENILCSSGVLTGQPSDMQDYYDFVHVFPASALSSLESGSLYSFRLVRQNGATTMTDWLYDGEKTVLNTDYFQTLGDTPFFFHPDEKRPEQQLLTMEVSLDSYYALRNLTLDDLKVAEYFQLMHTVSRELLEVTAMTNGRWSTEANNFYSSYLYDLTLDKPLSEVEYVVLYDGCELGYVYVEGTDEEAGYPTVHSASVTLEHPSLSGEYLPENKVYTAKVYQGYTCLTETPLAVTWLSDESLQLSSRDLKALKLEPGSYELRLWMDSTILGSVSLQVTNDNMPIVELHDARYGRNDHTSIIESGYYTFEVYNQGLYTTLRAAENPEALSKAQYSPIGYMEYSLSEGFGEKTICVQLASADGKHESDVLTFKVWSMEPGGTLSLTVPEDISGVYSGKNFTMNIGAECPYASAYAEFTGPDGGSTVIPLSYAGKTELKGLYPSAVHGLESSHPAGGSYEDVEQTVSYTVEGAKRISFTFSCLTDIPGYCDLDIYADEKATGTPVYSFRYDEENRYAGKTFTLPGDSVTIQMHGFCTDFAYGFAVTDIWDADKGPEVTEEALTHVFTTGLIDLSDYYLDDYDTVKFYLKNDNTNQIISDVVERILIFGDPDTVILPQFRNNGTVYSKESTYDLYGYAMPGSTVTLNTYGMEPLTATAESTGFFRFELKDLTEGDHFFTVSDNSGQTASAYASLCVDTTAPVIESIHFTFGDNSAATLRWVCEDTDISFFEIHKNGVMLSRRVSADSRTYSVAASFDDGNRFTVRAVDYAGNYGELTVSTADQEPPTAPERLTAEVTTAAATLNWTEGTDNIGVMGYIVYADGVELLRLDDPETRSVTVELEPEETHTYTVRTRDKAGNLSPDSPSVTVTPVKLTAALDLEDSYVVDLYPSMTIPVQCTLTADAEDYTAYFSKAQLEYQPADTEEEEWLFCGNLDRDGFGLWNICDEETGSWLEGTYKVRLQGMDQYSVPVTSEPVTVSLLPDTEAPTAPGASEATSHTTTSITFRWEAAKDNVAVDHYEIWRDGEKIAETKACAYEDTGLESGLYTYTIKAVDARGNVSEASEEAQLRTLLLNFADAVELDASYVLEEQENAAIPVWAAFLPEEGYPTKVTMSLQYKAAEADQWISAPMTADVKDVNLFFGSWDLSGEELGYLPIGDYQVRFAVTDGGATAYTEAQTVTLTGETAAPVVDTVSPESGTFGGTELTVSAYATDNVAVTGYSFRFAKEGEAQTEIASGTDDLCTWDISKLESGTYLITAVAEDARGNKGEKTVSITIDHTPPAPPTQLTAEATSRYIHVMWNTDYVPSKDFSGFRIYRGKTAEPSAEPVLMAQQRSIGYYDDGTSAIAGTEYVYTVTAVDVYGNESPVTESVTATLVKDTESPEIYDMMPEEGRSLRKEVSLQVSASDNYRLAKAVFSYRKPGGTWTEIGTAEAEEAVNSFLFQLDWILPTDIQKGAYELRAQVYDDSIRDVDAGRGYTANAPAELIRQVILNPYHAPVAPAVTAQAAYKKATLSWTYSGETETLRQFVVYKTDASGNNRTYVQAVPAGKTGSAVVTIPADGAQYFVVQAEDAYQVTADSKVITVTSLPKETEAPVAVLQPETLVAATGVPFRFSAANSTDNDVIAAYSWTFGDGNTASGKTCEHTYNTAGTYTVTLTVTDACGNAGKATGTMKVYDISSPDAGHALMTLSVVNAYVSGTPAIAGADVKIYAQDENGLTTFETSALADDNGKVTAVVPVGSLTVSAVSGGFLAATRTVEVIRDQNGTFAYTLGMSPMNVSMVDGSLSVKEMTYDEIVKAGIDVTDPDNNHVWKFAATLEFVAAPAFPFDLPKLPIEGFFNGFGKFLGGTGFGWNFFGGGGGGGGGGGWGGMNIGVFPISEKFLLVIYGEAHWLKEMYNVELIVINNSYVDDITDCEATLHLPDGLSLAAMYGKAQTPTVDLGTIKHKLSEDDTTYMSRAVWYVRGDKEGSYNLTASVTGNNPEPFVKTFTTDKPVKVYAGSALKLYITAEDIAYRDEEYHVRFELKNVSDKELYNLSFGITGAEQFKIVEMGNTTMEQTLTHEDFGKNMTRKVKTLKPQESIVIDFYTTVWFNSILELVDMGPFDVGYYLTNVFVTTLEGSTTTIPYEVSIAHSSHGTFFEWLYEEAKDKLEGDIVDLVDDTFFGGIPVLSTSKKIYEFKAGGEADSRCDISLTGGSFVQSDNVISLMGAQDSGAIAVYTDGEYTISEDGSTMTLLGDGKIYVEGCGYGDATMTVTTYANNGEREHVYTLDYQVTYGEAEAEDLLLLPPAAQPDSEAGTYAAPLEGDTLQITFPYLLKAADGSYLTEAENAVWSVTGAGTDGLSMENGVLTVESTVTAGTYTVSLTVGDKTASHEITVTKEPSVATRVEICTDNTVLEDRYTVNKTFGTCTFTALVTDQYGVEMAAPVTWTAADNTTDAVLSGGVLTPGSRTGSVTLQVCVNNDPALTDTLQLAIVGDLTVEKVSQTATAYTAKIENPYSAEVSVQAVAAAYDGKGKLLSHEYLSVTIDPNDSAELSLSYASGTLGSVKVFILNTATAAPLMEAWTE